MKENVSALRPGMDIFATSACTYRPRVETGVSSAQLSQYAHGYRRPSPKTARRIQRSLHAFGRELSQLRFI